MSVVEMEDIVMFVKHKNLKTGGNEEDRSHNANDEVKNG